MAAQTDLVALHRQYSPSVWSKRFATGPEVEQYHVNLVTRESEKATNSIPNKLEIEYGSTAGQKLDILGTDLPDDSPILVFIHGGYWQHLSREISRYPATPLYKRKIKMIVLGYDLCPNTTLPEIVDGIFKAAKFVFEYAEKMGSRGVYFAGHSAGAHLVAKLLSNREFLENTPGARRLQGVFLIAGIYDLRELVQTPENDAIQLPPEQAVTMSPQFNCFNHLEDSNVRIYIIVGQHDSPTFIKQSRAIYEVLYDACQMQNLYFEIKDNRDHFDIMECLCLGDNYLRNLLVHDIGKYL